MAHAPSITIGIDPGKLWSALAIVDPAKKTIVLAEIRSTHRRDDLCVALAGVEEAGAVIEGQQIRRGGKVDAQDIVDLAQEAGRLAGMLEGAGMAVEMPRPQAWKGSCPKEAHNARVEARVARDGYVLDWGSIIPSKRNHYWDAIGLALFLLDGRKTISIRT